MSVRARVGLVVLWIASLLTVRAVTMEQAHGWQPLQTAPIIVAGDDIGFRVEGAIGDVPAGTLVIRQNGVWIEPRWKPGIRPAR